MSVPTLGFSDAVMTVELLSSSVILIVLAMLAGLIVGKQESDSGDPTKKNETMFDWIEDAAYGLFGGMILVSSVVSGLIAISPITASVLGGFGGRKIIRDLIEKYK